MKKILLLFAVGLVVTLLTPNRALVDINVRQGEVWSEPTLIAPFDIPIQKPQSVIDRGREEALANFSPVFRIDHSVVERLVKSADLTPRQQEQLRRFYARGVVAQSEAQSYTGKIVRVGGERNMLTAYPIDELYTTAEVADSIGNLQINIVPNLTYDERLNKELRAAAVEGVSTTRSMIRAGDAIVQNGQPVDDNTLQLIRSFGLEYETRIASDGRFYLLLLGRFLFILFLLAVNYKFIMSFAHHYFGKGNREWTFLLLLYLLMAAMTALAVNLKGVSPYVVPLPVVAIYLMNYFNMRVAILGNITVAMIAALFVRIPFDLFAVNFTAGMVAIFMMRHHYHRNNLFRAIGAIFATQCVMYVVVMLIREGSISAIKPMVFAWTIVNGFLILGFYQLVYLIERFFGFVSDVTLLELCDTNQSLLLELAQNAPGTFQHSVQVANMAEAAAKEIGANPLLARTGALYHDIGKLTNPFHFTENQTGEFNPHNDLDPAQSAAIIRAHVTEGIALAEKHSLPDQVVNFIARHHGTSLMYFFYDAQRKAAGEAAIEEFSYPGPKPSAKEEAICMMADAVEAASRSLPSYDKAPLEALVDKIIDTQIAGHQLDDSELTFEEVGKIRALFKQRLNTIYHVRISYPERK